MENNKQEFIQFALTKGVLKFGEFTVPIMVEPNIDSGAIGGAVVNDLNYDFGILV